MPKQLIIHVAQNGKAKINVQGCTGNECLSLTKPLEKLLGPIEQRDEKPELVTSVEQEQQLHAG